MSLKQKPEKKSRAVIHRAGWVLIDPWTIYPNGWVWVENGKISRAGQNRVDTDPEQVIDHGPGVLMPPLVNAHTHLELCALKGKTATAQGFIGWIESIISLRQTLDEQTQIQAAAEGIREMMDSGTLVIGDIATQGLSREIFLNSSICGVWFKEYLGIILEDDPSCVKIGEDRAVSVAGHAPHTTGPEVLVRLKQTARHCGLPFSLHLAESEDEVLFLTSGKGKWADFLGRRGIDISSLKTPGKSPVSYVDDLGILDESTLAVHLVFAKKKEIERMAEKKVKVCLCPRSNLNLHNRLPDLSAMMDAGIKPCLGTDSLASVSSLSMFDEMRFAARSYPGISAADILATATVNGASALGLDKRFGRLAPGFDGRMIYVPIRASRPSELLDVIVTADFKQPITVIDENIRPNI